MTRQAGAARPAAAVGAGRDRAGAGCADGRVQPRARRPARQRRERRRASPRLRRARSAAGQARPDRARRGARRGHARHPDLGVPRAPAHSSAPGPSAADNARRGRAGPSAPTCGPMSAATDTRLYALPVVSGGRRLGTVVAGVSLAPYEQTRRTALVASAILALLAFGRGRRWPPAADHEGASTRRADDHPGGRMERPRARPPVRRSARLATS